jgi:hypothetical protein
MTVIGIMLYKGWPKGERFYADQMPFPARACRAGRSGSIGARMEPSTATMVELRLR